jgi:hypothetical protein
MKKKILVVGVVLVFVVVLAAFLVPIEVGGKRGTPKSGGPDYAEALQSKALPPVPPEFGGMVKETLKGSKAWWPPAVVPHKTAPNVLLIMTDDVGFGAPSIDDRDYQCPFRFTGKLAKLTVEQKPMKGTLADIIKFMWQTAD